MVDYRQDHRSGFEIRPNRIYDISLLNAQIGLMLSRFKSCLGYQWV
jgi:hypothetical protein